MDAVRRPFRVVDEVDGSVDDLGLGFRFDVDDDDFAVLVPVENLLAIGRPGAARDVVRVPGEHGELIAWLQRRK